MRWSITPMPAALTVALTAVLTACDPRPEQPPAGEDIRIISLSPAISRTLVDLGADGLIVGRTRYCDMLDPDVPVVGDLSWLDYEGLVRLEPTHVLVQPPAGGIDPELLRLAGEHGWWLTGWRIETIDDIRRVIDDMPQMLYEDDDEQRGPTVARAAELLQQLDTTIASSASLGWSGRVMLIHEVDPIGVFGTATYLSDLLDAMGAANAVSGRGWLIVTVEDVVRIEPDAIIVIRPGAGPGTDPLEVAEILASLEIEAITERRVALLTHPDALRPCSGVIGVAAQLRDILASFSEPQP